MNIAEENVVRQLGPFLLQPEGGDAQHTLKYCMEALWKARCVLGIDYRRTKKFFGEVLGEYQGQHDDSREPIESWDLETYAGCIKDTISGLRRHSDEIEKLNINSLIVAKLINLLRCAEHIVQNCMAGKETLIYLDDRDSWTFPDSDQEDGVSTRKSTSSLRTRWSDAVDRSQRRFQDISSSWRTTARSPQPVSPSGTWSHTIALPMVDEEEDDESRY